MRSYLLDTNVISETVRPKPNERVVEWFRRLQTLLLPSVVVYELASGIHRLPTGKRRRTLEEWLAALLSSQCEVLALDRDAALASADVEVAARRQGRSIEHRDLLLLGIARARSLGVATRNTAHFRGLGVPIYDPFEDTYLL